MNPGDRHAAAPAVNPQAGPRPLARVAAAWDRDDVRRATLDALPTHILTLDGDNRIVAANEPWRRFALGSALHPDGDGVGCDYPDVCRDVLGANEEQLRLISAGLEAIRAGTHAEFSLLVSSRIDGQEHALLLRATPLRAAGIDGIVAIHTDVSEHVRAERRLSHLAYHDTLTGLPNRLLFHDRLQGALALSRRNRWLMAVLFVDLDRFKTINDTLGHEVGDKLLQEAARRLQRSVRDCDTVCRMGGDEFALVLPELGDMEEAAQVPQRIVESLRAPLRIDDHELALTASIGIALFPTDAEEPDALMRCADAAMYQAKKFGRDNYQFYAAGMDLGAAAPIRLR